MAEPTQPIIVADEAISDAPVIFIDGAQTIAANDHVVRFNLFQDRATSDAKKLQRVVCARLVMSHSTFQSLTDWLQTHAPKVAAVAKGG